MLNKIIPYQGLTKIKGTGLDKEAICFWASAGFFFENDTFWKEVKWDLLDFDKQSWKHEPEEITLEVAVDRFARLFHQIIEEQVGDKKVILPLSGGLDSRTLAVSLDILGKEVFAFGYEFPAGVKETKYGEQIARALGWSFRKLAIRPGYLWNKIEEAASVNYCYAEFTHARQLAVAEDLSQQGDIWLLGHWGDVLFDDMGVDSQLPFDKQVDVLYKKILKKGGKELAKDLWDAWGIAGEFENELRQRIEKMHQRIAIEDANARIRAFKSLYWATRWTGTNIAFFEHYKPVVLPYYDDRMCEFVMQVPENLLVGRKIQIEYIKKYAPELAKIPWQAKAPYNLYNYDKHLTMQHLPYRVMKRLKRMTDEKILGKKLIQRNWELQFLGEGNKKHLEKWLFDNEKFSQLVPERIVRKYYELFRKDDSVYWSHPVSMLLTLSVFSNKFLD